jgi:hypothetical protein
MSLNLKPNLSEAGKRYFTPMRRATISTKS